MATTGSTKSLFENFYEEKLNIIVSFSEFGRITYVTKREKIKKKTKNKTYKAIMVRYEDSRTRDTYKLYNPETKRVIMKRDIKWE